MAFSNKIQDKTYPSVKLEVDKVEEKVYNETVQICSLIDAKVIITGTVTKTRYEFARAGTVVAVDIRDKDEILNKKKGRACCGGQSGKALFQLV
jgi:hypothetical protein